jgi:hypothetical protein
VTNLGVAHLAVRKTNVFSAGLKVAVRILFTQCVDVGGTLCPDSVGIVVAAFAPTVQNHEKYFSVHI